MSENEKVSLRFLEDAVIRREWNWFGQVRNEGGRAFCQDDWVTFRKMREAKFDVWSRDMLESYAGDLDVYDQTGLNPVMLKYAYMMESTAPERYEELKPYLPEVDAQRDGLIESITAWELADYRKFAESFPRFAAQSRSVSALEDASDNTSFETYLRGELKTYSLETLQCYRKRLQELEPTGSSLTQLTMDNIARQYGYLNTADAEKKLPGI